MFLIKDQILSVPFKRRVDLSTWVFLLELLTRSKKLGSMRVSLIKLLLCTKDVCTCLTEHSILFLMVRVMSLSSLLEEDISKNALQEEWDSYLMWKHTMMPKFRMSILKKIPLKSLLHNKFMKKCSMTGLLVLTELSQLCKGHISKLLTLTLTLTSMNMGIWNLTSLLLLKVNLEQCLMLFTSGLKQE